MRNKQSRHLGIVHSNSESIAGNAGLRHFKDSTADPVAIPDANLVVGKTLNGEILSKLPVLEVTSAKFALPISIGFELIDHDGSVLTAVAFQIGLPIAV